MWAQRVLNQFDSFAIPYDIARGSRHTYTYINKDICVKLTVVLIVLIIIVYEYIYLLHGLVEYSILIGQFRTRDTLLIQNRQTAVKDL